LISSLMPTQMLVLAKIASTKLQRIYKIPFRQQTRKAKKTSSGESGFNTWSLIDLRNYTLTASTI